jgi:short-subunit dehydrogenase
MNYRRIFDYNANAFKNGGLRMKSFQNKIAVVTGAGSGLGRALAIKLNLAGANLALCDLNMAGLDETRSLLSNQALKTTLHLVDVSSRKQMQNFANQVISQHGRVDILINNAGISLTPKFFDDISEEQFEKVININMWGVYHGIRAFLPHLQARPEAVIVNMSSLAGLVGLPTYSAYAMSKFAVRALSESLQSELSKTNISVLVVFPGGVKTNIIKNAPDLKENERASAHSSFTKYALLTADDVAERILRAMRKKKKRIIIGPDARIFSTIRNLFPNRFPAIFHTLFGQAMFK